MGKGKQNVISLNLRGMLRGGYRTIPIDLDASIAASREVRDYSQAFENSDPDYFRIDFGAEIGKINRSGRG